MSDSLSRGVEQRLRTNSTIVTTSRAADAAKFGRRGTANMDSRGTGQ